MTLDILLEYLLKFVGWDYLLITISVRTRMDIVPVHYQQPPTRIRSFSRLSPDISINDIKQSLSSFIGVV